MDIQKIYYCYTLVSSDEGGKNRGTVKCGPYELSAFDFNAVNSTALCWANPELVLKYEKKALYDKYPYGYTGKVTIEDYVVSAHNPGGEFMTLPVQRLSPLSVSF